MSKWNFSPNDPYINQNFRILMEFVANENYLKSSLETMFYPHTIEEIQGTLFAPIIQHLRQIKSDCETQLASGCRVRGKKRIVWKYFFCKYGLFYKYTVWLHNFVKLVRFWFRLKIVTIDNWVFLNNPHKFSGFKQQVVTAQECTLY